MGINLGTYSIRDGRGFVLPQEIWAAERGNYDLMLLMEINIPDTVYFLNHLGNDVVCSEETVIAYVGSQGVGGIVLLENPAGWIV